MRWFALKARPVIVPYRLTGPIIPHPFKYAMRNLQRQHFEVFCPIVREKWIYRGRRWDRERAVFPGYVFVFFNLLHERWRCINSTRGVIHLLPLHSEQPEALPFASLSAIHPADGCGRHTSCRGRLTVAARGFIQ